MVGTDDPRITDVIDEIPEEYGGVPPIFTTETSLTGITTSDDDVKLTAAGNLTLEAAVSLGEGDLFLDVEGDVSQITAGTIDAAGLGLRVDGETLLNEANDIDVLAANNNAATQFTDINDLRVDSVTIESVSADRALSGINIDTGILVGTDDPCITDVIDEIPEEYGGVPPIFTTETSLTGITTVSYTHLTLPTIYSV